MKGNEKLNELNAMNSEAKIERVDLNEDKLEQVTGGNWEDEHKQAYDKLYHGLQVSNYFSEFMTRLTNGTKESAKNYYNGIKSNLYEEDKGLFQDAYRQVTGESM